MSTEEEKDQDEALQMVRPTGMSVAELLSAPSDSPSTSIDSTAAMKRLDQAKESKAEFKLDSTKPSPSKKLPDVPTKQNLDFSLKEQAISTKSPSTSAEPKNPSVSKASNMETTTLTSGEGVAAYQYTAVKQIKHQREHIEYRLRIREQPKHSRMCGVGEKADRRPIDPAPIIQLRVIVHDHPAPKGWSAQSKGKEKSNEEIDDIRILPSKSVTNLGSIDGKAAVASTTVSSASGQKQIRRGIPVESSWGLGWEDKTWYLENPYYFMYAVLAHAEVDEELHLLQDGKTRYTTGSCVSCLYHLKDIDGSQQGFFVFPDLSIRVEGRYRLKLFLFETIGHEVHHCTSIFTTPFNVYTAKRFPGMEESTMLSRSFADQGLKVRIRKTPRIRRGRVSGSKRKDMVDSEDDSDELVHRSNTMESYSTNKAGQHMRAFPGLTKRPRNEGSIDYYPIQEHSHSTYQSSQPGISLQSRQISQQHEQQQSRMQQSSTSRAAEQSRGSLAQPQGVYRMSTSPPEPLHRTHREYQIQQRVERPFSRPPTNLQTPASELTSRRLQEEQQHQRQEKSAAEKYRSNQGHYPKYALPPPVGESYYQARPEMYRPKEERGLRRSPPLPSLNYRIDSAYEEQRGGAPTRSSRGDYEQANQPYYRRSSTNVPVLSSSVPLAEFSQSPPSNNQQDSRRDRERLVQRYSDESKRLNDDPRVTLPPLNVAFQSDQRPQYGQPHRSQHPSLYHGAGHAFSESLPRVDSRMQRQQQQQQQQQEEEEGSHSNLRTQSPRLPALHQQFREGYQRNNNQ